MDRYEVPMDAHLAPLVEAAERGDEVVIMRSGRVVARLASALPELPKPLNPMSMRESLDLVRTMTAHLPKMTPQEAAKLVRDMRDEID